MSPKGHGLMLFARIELHPSTPVVLRCARCPRWQKESTEGKRERDFARHAAGKRHQGITWSTSTQHRRYGV